MCGWQIPPPRKPSKSKADFARERRQKVASLIKQGLLKSERIKQALLKVPREDFIPEPYQDYGYQEVPLPLPGLAATISCPHSYPLSMSRWDSTGATSFSKSGWAQAMGQRSRARWWARKARWSQSKSTL
jgi:hypothetical protein